MKRHQRLFVIARNDKFYNGKAGWTDKLSLASVWPEKQANSKVNIDIGMPCKLIEIEPTLTIGEQTMGNRQNLIEIMAKEIHAATLPNVQWRDLRADSRIQKRAMAECALTVAEGWLGLEQVDEHHRSCVCLSYNRPRPYQTDGEVILDHAKYFPDTNRKTICVDACIADQIETLWMEGIRTGSCCCGHNERPWLDVGLVHPKDVERAAELLSEIDERLWHIWVYSTPTQENET